MLILAIAPVAALAQTMSLYSGSDTVQPVAEAALVSFVRGHANYKPQMRDTGTSPGLKDLCNGSTLLAGPSRLTSSEESKICAKAGIPAIEIFDPASAGKITSWKQIRPTFPNTSLKPSGAYIKSETFQFFSQSIGLQGFVRSD